MMAFAFFFCPSFFPEVLEPWVVLFELTLFRAGREMLSCCVGNVPVIATVWTEILSYWADMTLAPKK